MGMGVAGWAIEGVVGGGFLREGRIVTVEALRMGADWAMGGLGRVPAWWVLVEVYAGGFFVAGVVGSVGRGCVLRG